MCLLNIKGSEDGSIEKWSTLTLARFVIKMFYKLTPSLPFLLILSHFVTYFQVDFRGGDVPEGLL